MALAAGTRLGSYEILGRLKTEDGGRTRQEAFR